MITFKSPLTPLFQSGEQNQEMHGTKGVLTYFPLCKRGIEGDLRVNERLVL